MQHDAGDQRDRGHSRDDDFAATSTNELLSAIPPPRRPCMDRLVGEQALNVVAQCARAGVAIVEVRRQRLADERFEVALLERVRRERI
ncbi:MAG TPA: hypothetical protein VGM44_12895, partial [Polyangiaceae bacterium]